MSSEAPLRILHIMRAPMGGLFRHVVDLAREQARRGHAVGIVADSTTGSASAGQILADLAPALKLGITRTPMSRQIGPRDLAAFLHVRKRAQETRADVLHGHGAKGGAYARLVGGPAINAYTPHGGSLFYAPDSLAGRAYHSIERWLRSRTDLILFESEFARTIYRQCVGEPPFSRVIHNGISAAELAPVTPNPDAADFVFIGELRWRKGIDVLLEALAALAAEGWRGKALFYGAGPDRAAAEERARQLGLGTQVTFPGESKPRPAFASGKLLAIPSRQESLPYIVLEAAAARMPMITTSVGGIPEIFGPDAGALVPAGDKDALLAAMKRMQQGGGTELANRLQQRIARSFTVESMTDAVLAAYAEIRRTKSIISN
ncbi:MAG: glycosyltransferase family 4 protein [Bradyrhizobiaceae bacterium]|nr:glycosyltransferase family 4 protein [Bradyrhizobiaceae bacterium]